MLALALGGIGFVMFYFGGIRSGAVVPLVLGLMTVLLAAWLEPDVRLRQAPPAFSVVFGRKVVPVSEIAMARY